MDTMNIARGVYQYTAIDDCSRFRVLAVYPRRNARNTLRVLKSEVQHLDSYKVLRWKNDTNSSRLIGAASSLPKQCSRA